MINGSGTPAAADLAGAPPVKGTLNAIVVDQDDTISQGILSILLVFEGTFTTILILILQSYLSRQSNDATRNKFSEQNIFIGR